MSSYLVYHRNLTAIQLLSFYVTLFFVLPVCIDSVPVKLCTASHSSMGLPFIRRVRLHRTLPVADD